MGALFGLGIDNALIEIDNEEVPILDGSAKKFIEKIISAGIQASETPIKIIKINKPIEYREGERVISIKPSTLSLDIDFELKYKNQVIGNQKNKVKVYDDDLSKFLIPEHFAYLRTLSLLSRRSSKRWEFR